MTYENPIRLVRALKGAPLTILFAMSLVHQTVTAKWLAAITGYSSNSVTSALTTLQEYEMATCDSRRSHWQLTGQARQLPLGDSLLEGEIPDRDNRDLEPESQADQAEMQFPDRDNRDLETPPAADLADSSSSDRVFRDLDREKRDLGESLDSEVKEVKSSLTESLSLDSPQAGKPPEVETILSATNLLFGERVYAIPGFQDSGLLLSWLANAYDRREKLDHPARLVHNRLTKGARPDPEYLEDPARFLPPEFLAEIGLPVQEDPPTAPDLSPPIPADTPEERHCEYSWQRNWRAACELVGRESPSAAQYLQEAELIALGEGLAVIDVPNAYARDWLESRLTSTLTRVLSGMAGQSIQIRFQTG